MASARSGSGANTPRVVRVRPAVDPEIINRVTKAVKSGRKARKTFVATVRPGMGIRVSPLNSKTPTILASTYPAAHGVTIQVVSTLETYGASPELLDVARRAIARN